MALILVLSILALIIFIGVKLFKNKLARISFITCAIIILSIPSYIIPLNKFTSPFKLVTKLAYAEGSLGYVEFLQDEYNEVKNKEVKSDILNKIDFYQTNMDEEILMLSSVEKTFPINSKYLRGYLAMLDRAASTLEGKQTEMFFNL